MEQNKGTNMRILIVDDNEAAANALAALLAYHSYETRLAYDGASALEALAGFPAKTVLLDIGLPDRDGYSVAREIRSLEGGADIRLIAISGYGQEEDKRKSREAGFDLHLVKPVGIETLLKSLDSLKSQHNS